MKNSCGDLHHDCEIVAVRHVVCECFVVLAYGLLMYQVLVFLFCCAVKFWKSNKSVIELQDSNFAKNSVGAEFGVGGEFRPSPDFGGGGGVGVGVSSVCGVLT